MGRMLVSLAVAGAALAQTGVRGRVVSDVGGQAIESARVVLTSPSLEAPISGRSDAQGVFQVSVPAGRYSLECARTGFESLTLEDVEVKENAPLNLGDIYLTTPRVITGTVRWTDGEPVAEAFVVPLRISGGRARPERGGGRAGEDGSFCLEGLPPGRYILYVRGQRRGARPRRVSRPLFHAPPIDLRVVASASGISMVLEEDEGVTVEGTVRASAWLPAGTEVSVSLWQAGAPLSLASMSAEAGETFRLTGVPPGTYSLMTSPLRWNGGTDVRELVVGADSVSNLDVAPAEPAEISGQVEEETPEGRRPSRGRVLDGRDQRLEMYGGFQLTTGWDGRFNTRRAIRGKQYSLRFNPPPREAYVASFRQSDRDLSLRSVAAVAGPEPVHVLLKRDGGAITGRVLETGTPVGRGFVVLAPRNRDRIHNFRTATSRGDGYFKLAAIAPGEYDLFAFDRNDDDSFTEPGYLDKHAARAVRATVAPRAELSRDLTVIRLARE